MRGMRGANPRFLATCGNGRYSRAFRLCSTAFPAMQPALAAPNCLAAATGCWLAPR